MAERKIYSFPEIVSTVITKVGSLSANLTDFTEGSNVRSIIEAFSHFVEFLQLQTEVAFDAFSIRTAKGENLKNRARDYGLEPNEAVAAKGIIFLYRNSPATASFTIFSGSQVSTTPDIFGNTIDFTTDSDILFPSGAVSVSGYVTCSSVGTIGNVPSGYITNITGTIPGIDFVNNLTSFTSGGDADTDDQIRKKIPIHINGLKKANESAIIAAAISIDGITVGKVSENTPGPGQITVYISNQSGIPSQEQVSQVKAAVEDAAAFGISINVATPTVTYIGITADITYDSVNYKKEVVEATLKQSVYDLVSLNPLTELQLIDVAVLMREIPGVMNVKNVKIDGIADDKVINGFGVIRLLDKNTSIVINWIG